MSGCLLLGAVLCIQTAEAGCRPTVAQGSTAATICLNQTCDTMGETVIDGDQKNILACLKNDSGEMVWKSTSSGGSGGTGDWADGNTCTFTAWDYETGGCISTCPSGYKVVSGSCWVTPGTTGFGIVFTGKVSPTQWRCIIQHPGGGSDRSAAHGLAHCVKS